MLPLPPGAGASPASGPYKKNWLGLHFAQDFAIVGGNNDCDPTLGQKNENFACFYEGTSDVHSDAHPSANTPPPAKDDTETPSTPEPPSEAATEPAAAKPAD